MAIILALFLLSLPFVTPRVAASDEIEYFSYLPSILLDRDLDFSNQYEYFCQLDPEDCVRSRFKETFLDMRTPTGLQINFGPMGSAVLWLPFYLIAHFITVVLQNLSPAFVANGVSAPYIFAVSVASVFYGWLGIYLAYRIARNYSSEWIALGSALVVLLASSAVYYMYVAPAFSHAASLFASALFVFVWWKTRSSRAQRNLLAWFALGAAGGLMTMVREQEAVLFILPLVEAAWLLLQSLRRQTTFHQLARYVLGLLVMGLGAFLVFVPQFIVYRVLNGNFLPARNVTDKFIWDGAHVADILFSNFHGLFSWTPVTLLAVIGLVLLWRKDRMLAAAFLIALAAETYLLGSFSTWFGGAAFGARRFINCTAIFVVGLAAFVDALNSRVPRPVLVAGGAALVVWNLFFIVQFVTGMVPRQEPVDMLIMARNQFLGVPPRLVEIASRFLTNRASFYGD